MATEMAPPGGDLSYMANADLKAKQYYFVELLSTEKVDVCNGATDVAFGVLQNDPDISQAAQVRVADGYKTKIVSDGSGTNIAVGDWIGTGATGKAIKKTTDKDWVFGVAEDPSTADGTIITVRIEKQFLAV